MVDLPLSFYLNRQKIDKTNAGRIEDTGKIYMYKKSNTKTKTETQLDTPTQTLKHRKYESKKT